MHLKSRIERLEKANNTDCLPHVIALKLGETPEEAVDSYRKANPADNGLLVVTYEPNKEKVEK